MDNPNIGISLSRKYTLPITDVIPMIAKAGFAAVSPLWGTKVDMAQVCTLARAQGLAIQSMHAPFGKVDTLWSDDPAVSETALALTMRALDDCITHQIPILVMHAWIDEDLSFDLSHLYFGNFETIVERAASNGIRIAFENTEGEEYLSSLMAHFQDHSSVGFCWDSGHEMCYNHSQDLLARYGDRLLVTHLNDNLGISDPDGNITYLDDLHLLPYDGIADWEYNTQRLNKSRPLPYLNFELNLTSKPDRHENDVYAQMPLEQYFALAYERACRVASQYRP